jgi:photosystem II stability/assembly factor-like uncharacterized protein
MNKPSRLLLGLALAAGLAAPAALAAPAKSPLERPAMASAKASKSLLVDIAQAGQRLVAVGERGHIVFSDDGGRNWSQAKVPVSVMLTSVYFATPKLGWAVGHNGVVLHSQDGGASWSLQRADRDADSEKAGAPLLGVWFADPSNGLAVGAYGYLLATADGGATWTDHSAAVDNPDGWHLNAVRGIPGGAVFIVGEHGKLFRSLDNGATWSSIPSPFEGSFFGVAPLAPDLVLIYGLQGRLFASADQGSTWQQVQTGVTSGINAAARLDNGKVVVGGNAGVVLVAADSRLDLVPELQTDRKSVMALLPAGGNGIVTVGEGGAKAITLGQK